MISMAVLGYCLLVVSLVVVLISMGQVWLCGLAHALGTREISSADRGRKLFWVGAMLLFGWLGAVTYWAMATPRSA
jgi:fatty-acid desaturase